MFDNTNKNNKKSVSSSFSKKKTSSPETSTYENNHPITNEVSRYQDLANNSDQVQQLKSYQDKAEGVNYNPIIQRVINFKDEDEGRKNSKQNYIRKRQEEVENSIPGQAAAFANSDQELKHVPFDPRELSKTNAAIRARGNEIEEKEQKYSPVEGPMPKDHAKKPNDSTRLGKDLERIQDDIDYDFDPKTDHWNALSRTLHAKGVGALHYANKHKGKTAAKLVPVLPIVMNASAAVGGEVRRRDAEQEKKKMEASKSEGGKLMWEALIKKQTKIRNKKAIATLFNVITAAIGGLADFGAGDAAGDITADIGSDAANNFMDSDAVKELLEAAEQFFVDENDIASPGAMGEAETDAGNVAEGLGKAYSEAATEDVTSGATEDTAQGSKDKVEEKLTRKNLIPKARLARQELNKSGGDKVLALESLLAKDPKFGKSLREAARKTLEVSIPDKAAPAGIDTEETKRAKSHLHTNLQEAMEIHDPKTTREGDLTPSGEVERGDRTILPSTFKDQQRETHEASMHRIREDLGYVGKQGGHFSSKEEAEQADKKIDTFGKKRWIES